MDCVQIVARSRKRVAPFRSETACRARFMGACLIAAKDVIRQAAEVAAPEEARELWSRCSRCQVQGLGCQREFGSQQVEVGDPESFAPELQGVLLQLLRLPGRCLSTSSFPADLAGKRLRQEPVSFTPAKTTAALPVS